MTKKPDSASNPLPSPRTGEVNMVGPADRAQEATGKPYDAETGHIEPPMEHDEEGVRRKSDDRGDRTGSKSRSEKHIEQQKSPRG